MKLNFEQIKSITLGAERVTEEGEGIRFYRFTQEQEELYRVRHNGFYLNTFSTSGVEFRFETDAKELFLKAVAEPQRTRKYFAIEVLVNGKRVGAIDNFSNVELPRNYTEFKLPYGMVQSSFELGEGMKEVRVLFPWTSKTEILEVSVTDGATIVPKKPKYKLLAFGDSITQGYDALYPSNKYVTKLAAYLNAEEYNKAIGGEIMFPELAAAKVGFEPDYITVAYGTNDWSKTDSETFEKNGRAFFENLCANYPNSKIYVITPIWRKKYLDEKPFGDFKKASEILHRVTEGQKNITVIEGFDLVEHDSDYFADLVLHPNDKGFEQYFEGLKNAIQPKE